MGWNGGARNHRRARAPTSVDRVKRLLNLGDGRGVDKPTPPSREAPIARFRKPPQTR